MKQLSEDDFNFLRNWNNIKKNMSKPKNIKPIKLSISEKSYLSNFLCGWCDNKLSNINDCATSHLRCSQESRNIRALKCLENMKGKNNE